ncbi:Deoxycytidylate deaminase [Paracoccus thiocyanatus]|uniref:Deoxycytidylate deaminase n=1 Tax=Paracoccus thiocyanatus TaxID=34006 RepID=A0A1N7AIB2_9RHOB|nr:anti-phage dCTP deaminase [Paracoccus thiocyanatus]SIR38880.1 Deoxycytidylate deaminase [Paracoccus thiocyanatus]
MGASTAVKETLVVEVGEQDARPLRVDRPTEELVVGLVGAVGAGVSTTAELLRDKLEKEYGYTVSIIKASDLIRENAAKTVKPAPAEGGSDRIKDLQEVGTLLRDKFGEDYVAAKAIEAIAVYRSAAGGYDESTQVPQPKRLRQATIIDSLKHPRETELLRRVYGGMYWQFTVFAPEAVRESRLKVQGIEKDDLAGIFTRDENDREGDHGQKVSKTAYLSDYFVRNDGQNDVRLGAVVDRYLEIIFNISVHTPTSDEAGMYAAVSAASKSACLSRQVGAAIYSGKGELLGVGWNDVPKGGGGLYSADDRDRDHRCFKWGGRVCHNDRKKEDLYTKIYDRLSREGLLVKGASRDQLRTQLLKTPVRDLIEYSRSIHAEMEAIVSAARSGKPGIVGSTLYTTTFPCHNCARHIVAAGISKVFYVEPYAKSLALELHSDSIGVIGDAGGQCAFLQYEGVGPDSALKLFHHGVERKQGGKAIIQEKKEALPVLPPPMDGFTTHEKRVIRRIADAEAEVAHAESGVGR